jgi:hypothetical protein
VSPSPFSVRWAELASIMYWFLVFSLRDHLRWFAVGNLRSIKPKSVTLAFQHLMSGASFSYLTIPSFRFKRSPRAICYKKSPETRCCITMGVALSCNNSFWGAEVALRLLVKWMQRYPNRWYGTKICAIAVEKTSPSPSCIDSIRLASAS